MKETAAPKIEASKQNVYRTAPAWWGFTSADDGKRLEAFTQRGVRLGLDNDDEPTLTQLADKLEDFNVS